METYGKILLVAMPVFLLLVLAEKAWGWWRGKDTVKTLDMISSLSSGITNVTKDVLGLSIALLSYEWMVSHWALVSIQANVFTYVVAFMALDFAGYWVHRIDHEYNFFWNAHIVHHSSEEFNLACALRQSISTFFRLFTIFLLPAALLGVPASVIAVVGPLHLFAQFWYHTQHIDKMGWLENIMVTPSHHRVHHALNPVYLDKNYGQIFIFWDKWFGTYQAELKDVPPVYGITRPVQTWNPIRINFQHLWLLVQDAWRTADWKDKFRLWLMPTGWRPADMALAYPVHKIEDPYHFNKYNTPANAVYQTWLWIQLLVLLLVISYLFGNIAQIGSPGMFWYGGFVFLYVYALTENMDGHRWAWVWETLKLSSGLGLLWAFPGWFGAANAWPVFPYVWGSYLVLSWLAGFYFTLDRRS
ncbi:MAG: sterol desaturase family protein [Sphingobacteriia bacterium]|nr:MAG: sterol desaturase family protein [Sphingobacteriia bacterium]